MTAIITGTITRIYNKELPEPDRYDNKFRLSIAIKGDTEGAEDTWVQLGAQKRTGLSVKEGKGWVQLGEGSRVLVKATKNGDFLNSTISNIIVEKVVEPKTVNQAVEESKAKQEQAKEAALTPSEDVRPTSQYWKEKDAGQAAAHSLRAAIDILIANKHTSPDIQHILNKAEDIAMQVQQSVLRVRDRILNGDLSKEKDTEKDEKVNKVQPKPKTRKPEEEPLPEEPRYNVNDSDIDDFQDDEIPF